MIEVKGLSKSYNLSKRQMKQKHAKAKVMKAVEDVSFVAKEGEIFGLLGPNGAGKTTTLRSIVTLLKPTEGDVIVQGYSVIKEPAQVRKKIGFLTNELKLDVHFTPAYTMKYFGRLHGMTEAEINKRTKELFDYFGIREYAHKKIGELSTGMGQKLSIAVSVIHNPEVIIFDEPTNGLDIITAKAVTEYLEKLRDAGKVVIISTHIMTVAEQLCDHIAVIIKGEKVIEGSLAHILQETDTINLEDAFFELYNQKVGGH